MTTIEADAELLAEAKRRAQKAMPSLTDAQWQAWLARALSSGASIVLTLDGAYAAYPLAVAPAGQTFAASGGAP